MQRQLNLILNGKGGVGKSFFAVNFIQYLKDQQIQRIAIDTDNENSTLKRFHPEARFVNLANAREIDELVVAVETAPLVVVDCRAAPTDLFLAYFAELAVFGVLKSIDTVLTVVSPVNHDLDSVEQVRILPSYGIRHAGRTEPWQPVGSAHSCSSSSHHWNYPEPASVPLRVTTEALLPHVQGPQLHVSLAPIGCRQDWLDGESAKVTF
jgi:hypothetical protein